MQPVTTFEEKTIHEMKTVMKDVVKNVVKTKMVPKTSLENHVKYEKREVMTKAYRMVNKKIMERTSVPVYADPSSKCWCADPKECPCAQKTVSYKYIQVPKTITVAEEYVLPSAVYVPVKFQKAVTIHLPEEYTEEVTTQVPTEVSVARKIQVPVTTYVPFEYTTPHMVSVLETKDVPHVEEVSKTTYVPETR